MRVHCPLFCGHAPATIAAVMNSTVFRERSAHHSNCGGNFQMTEQKIKEPPTTATDKHTKETATDQTKRDHPPEKH